MALAVTDLWRRRAKGAGTWPSLSLTFHPELLSNTIDTDLIRQIYLENFHLVKPSDPALPFSSSHLYLQTSWIIKEEACNREVHHQILFSLCQDLSIDK